ncbi:MAG: insulinase family protein [bacterium]|nr:insulinase family protein [bacterium]
MTRRAPQPFDRSRPPPVGEIRGVRFPPFTRAQLANGLSILTARLPNFPLINVEVLAPAGGQHTPMGHAGLASLHGGLLDEGTLRRSSPEIAMAVEQLGGMLTSGTDWDCAYVATGLLSTHGDAGLELVAEIIRSPSFPVDEIERLRGQRLAEILRRKDHPAALAERAFIRAVYGDTVYAQPLIGTEESVGALRREHLVDFYRRHVGPRGSFLIAVGDLDPDRLVTRIGEVFGDWPEQPGVARPVIEPAALPRTEVHIVDRPGSAQTELRLGHVGIFRNHPDHPKTVLLNTIFGGKFTSRINLNLREKHGYTYGAHSQFVFRQGRGPFVIRAAVATEVAGAAVRELVHELRKIREELVTPIELRETQDYVIGVFPSLLQTTGEVAKRLENLALFDLGDDYYEAYPAVLRELSREDVLEAARRYLHPDHLAIVVVGPADELRPQLESCGPVRVVTP